MARVSFDNLHVTSHKIVNTLFRRGLIIGDPATQRVVGRVGQRKMSEPTYGAATGDFLLLPKFDEQERPYLNETPVSPEALMYWALHYRYPNCRVRIIGYGRPDQRLPKSLITQALEFMGPHA